MLTKLREGASSWPAKVILCVVALSFVGWGVGDVFVDRGETTVAEVGAKDIDVRDLQTVYRSQIRSLQQNGIRVDPGSDIARLQARIALERLVRDTLLDSTASDFGITAGDDTLRAAIASNETFHDIAGTFSRSVFAGVLSMNGLTEEVFLARLDQEITRNQLLQSLVAIPPLPDDLLRRVTQYRQEKRTVQIAVIPNGALVSLPQPIESELAVWFDERAASYRTPEYRSARFLLVYPEDIAEGIAVSPGEIEEAYNARMGRWTVPERRLVRQIRFETREEAEAAYGSDFDVIAPEGTEAQWYEKKDLLEELSGPVFSVADGETTRPVESPLGGWLIYTVDEIADESVTSLEEVRDSLGAELRLAEARYAMFDLADDLDDLIASGATVPETASTLGLNMRLIDRASSTGDPEDPDSLQIIPATPGFLDEVFLGDLGIVSTVLETDNGGLLVVEVTEIAPARSRSLNEARQEVLGDWQEGRQAELALKEAQRLVAGVGSSGILDDIFQFADATFEVSEPFSRSEVPTVANVAHPTVEAVFDARPGDTVVTPSADGNAQVVARLVDINPADFSPVSGNSARIGDGLKQGLVSDVVELLSSNMRETFPVSIDHGLIEQYF